MKLFFPLLCKALIISELSLLIAFDGCWQKAPPSQPADKTLLATDTTLLRAWHWENISIPDYQWPDGTAFGNGLFVDVAYDPQGVTIVDDQLRFQIDPEFPKVPSNAGSPYHYRSEIRTAPWPIEHPPGTEQWLGWRYYFGKKYIPDTTSPITIFQNHPGVRGLSPQFELEIAAKDNPAPAQGGEIQMVNAANNDRIVLPVKPLAGEVLDVVIHVIYGLGREGLLQLWLNGELYYDRYVSTIYQDYPWGGNNKWGIYHHTFNDSPEDVQSSLEMGAGQFDLYMGSLRMLTRSPSNPEYAYNAYYLVKPR